MLNINPINYHNNKYSLTKKTEKVQPITHVSSYKDKNMDDDSNSSDFQKILEEEIQKQKKKKKIYEK